MNIEELYHDYLFIKKLKSPLQVKVRMMTSLLEQYEGSWKIVGITRQALEKFYRKDFKYERFMEINHSHLFDRHKTYKEMLTKDMNEKEWWDLFLKNDECVLSLSNENKNVKNEIPFETDGNLFKKKGFGWRHTKQEQEFLRNLYENLEI